MTYITYVKDGAYQVLKLNVIKINEFLEVVNDCIGPIHLLSAESNKTNIHQNKIEQSDLENKHRLNGKFLSVCLDIPKTKDYFKIVNFTIGDC